MLFVAFLSFFVFPWPSPLRVINVIIIIIIIIIISLLRRHWTSQGWEDPLEAPYLDPFLGYAGEDCADAFDDEGFSSWYFDQE